MKRTLQGTRAMVTGGSHGLGPVIAAALAERGADVALSARSEEDLVRTAERLAADHGVRTVALVADITDPASRAELVERAEGELGPIDLLVNNAGIELLAHFDRLPAGTIDRIVSTNLLGPLQLTRAWLPRLLERGRGHVVTVSSLGGKRGFPYSASYAATKAGLIAWSNAPREELRGTGVSASVICPGFVEDAGMYAVYEREAPRLAGTTRPEKVGQAVIRAVERDRREILINPGPLWLMRLVDELWPDLLSWVFRRAGVYRYYEEQAAINEARLAGHDVYFGGDTRIDLDRDRDSHNARH